MLIHSSLRARKEPYDTFEDRVRDQPTNPAMSYCVVNVSSLEQVGDQGVNWQSTSKLSAKDLKSTERLGEGEKARSEAHGDGMGISLDGLICNVC